MYFTFKAVTIDTTNNSNNNDNLGDDTNNNGDNDNNGNDKVAGTRDGKGGDWSKYV